MRGDSLHEESRLPSEKIRREILAEDDLIKYFLLHGGWEYHLHFVFAASPHCVESFLSFPGFSHRFPTQADIEHKSGPPKGPLSPEVDTESRKSNLKWLQKSELLPKGNLLIGSEF